MNGMMQLMTTIGGAPKVHVELNGAAEIG